MPYYGFLYLFEFPAILNLQNNYTDRKIIKVLAKRTEANEKKFSLVLLKIDSKILGTMLINKFKVYILFIFKGNNFFSRFFIFGVDLSNSFVFLSYRVTIQLMRYLNKI